MLLVPKLVSELSVMNALSFTYNGEYMKWPLVQLTGIFVNFGVTKHV